MRKILFMTIALILLINTYPISATPQDAAVTVSSPYITEANINQGTVTMSWDVVVMNGGYEPILEYPVYIPLIKNYISYEVYSGTQKIPSSIAEEVLAFPARDIPPQGMRVYTVNAIVKGITVSEWVRKLDGIYYNSRNEQCNVYELNLKNNADFKIKDAAYDWGKFEISEARQDHIAGDRIVTWSSGGRYHFKLDMEPYEETRIYIYERRSSNPIRESLNQALRGEILAIYGLLSIIIVILLAIYITYKNKDKPKKIVANLRNNKGKKKNRNS